MYFPAESAARVCRSACLPQREAAEKVRAFLRFKRKSQFKSYKKIVLYLAV